MPRGYETVIGEENGLLSGGEKQRLTIARAFLQDAPVLILDEATAQLDPDSENEIHRAMTALSSGRTVVVVAHRLASITSADQILVIDGGRIAQRGAHRELLAAPGRYAQLWAAQAATHGARGDRKSRGPSDTRKSSGAHDVREACKSCGASDTRKSSDASDASAARDSREASEAHRTGEEGTA
jgi:ABC-type multidrug transport system ATPase subunit